MLRKGAIQKVQPSLDQFLSSIFVIPKKDTGHRPLINLKKLNTIPYEHFKIGGLFLLKEVLQKEDYMCQIDLKDAYFSVPLHPESQKFVRKFYRTVENSGSSFQEADGATNNIYR